MVLVHSYRMNDEGVADMKQVAREEHFMADLLLVGHVSDMLSLRRGIFGMD